MGQAQSDVVSSCIETTNRDPSSSSFESPVAESTTSGNDENESIDAKARKVLQCPCIADLRNGSCGSQFSEAFLCFLKSTAEEKGSDCVHPFVALQKCMKENPDAFSKELLAEDGGENDKKSSLKYRLIPPSWSLESRTPKPKL